MSNGEHFASCHECTENKQVFFFWNPEEHVPFSTAFKISSPKHHSSICWHCIYQEWGYFAVFCWFSRNLARALHSVMNQDMQLELRECYLKFTITSSCWRIVSMHRDCSSPPNSEHRKNCLKSTCCYFNVQIFCCREMVKFPLHLILGNLAHCLAVSSLRIPSFPAARLAGDISARQGNFRHQAVLCRSRIFASPHR